jgi:predicted ATPase
MAEDAAEDGSPAHPVPFISRVRLKNYKSIASCDVRLDPLTILVGPNGSGKSNFLDSLAFLTQALNESLVEAIEERGGLDKILCRAPAPSDSFSVAVEASFPWWPSTPEFTASYEFEIGRAGPDRRGPQVIHEECVIRGEGRRWHFRARGGRTEFDDSYVRVSVHPFDPDRLFLRRASDDAPFSQLYAGLSRSLFYNFDTETLRKPQPSAARAILGHSGDGFGEVLAALAADSPYYKSRLDAYLSAVVQNATGIEPVSVGGYTVVELRTDVDGREVVFDSRSMSDGTLRAAAVLTALFQPAAASDGRLPLVGLEEPETALHPAAAGVLFDALTEASEHAQIIATTQSSDLLDREEIDASIIRPVIMQDGLTVIGELDEASREIVETKLFTLGELMRSNQLAPTASGSGGQET